jgi:phosphohistidine phosphatase
MKRLLLVRHAKSDWSDPSLPDHDRPLNKRGERDAPRMAALWAESLPVPDLIVSSTARRARQTATAFAKAWKKDPKTILLREDLYLASPRTWLKVVKSLPREAQFVALFGHNEGISEFVEELLGRDWESMPTCAGALVSMAIEEWADVSAGLGMLERYEYPKKYWN